MSEINLKINLDSSQGVAALHTLAKAFSNVKDKEDETKQSSESVFTGLAGRLVAVNQGLEAIKKVYDVLRKPLSIAGDFEKYEVQFKVLLGSADAAKVRIKELSDFAASTPFELPEVVKASKLLQTFGGDAIATGETLRMVGDMAAASGAGFQEVAMWVGRAYTNIQAGRPFGEASARLQELGLMSGEVRAKLEELQKNGAGGKQVWEAFTQSMGQFNGMMKDQSQTIEGLMSTMSDSFNMILLDIGNAFLPAMKSVVQWVTSMTDAFKKWSDSSKVIVAGTVAIASAFILLNSSVSPMYYALGGVVTLFTAFVIGLKEGNAPIIMITTYITALAVAYVLLHAKSLLASGAIISNIIPALWKLAIAVNAATGGWGLIIAGLAALAAAGIMYLRQSSEEAAKIAKAETDAITKNVDDAIKTISSLPPAKAKIEWEFQVTDLDAQINKLIEKRRELQKNNASDEELQAINAQIDASIAAFNKLLIAKNKIGEQQRKIDAETTKKNKEETDKQQKISFELEEKKIELMQDGYAKRKAQAELEYEQEVARLNERLSKNELSEKQYTKFLEIEAEKRRRVVELGTSPVAKLDAQNAKLIQSEKKKAKELKKVDESLIKSGDELHDQWLQNVDEEIAAMERQTAQSVLFAAQQYDSQKNFGVQMNQLLNEQIRQRIAMFIADAIAGVMSKIIAALGPIGFLVAPAAGLTAQMMIEKAIPKFGGGGKVPGSGNEDNVLAFLTPGERVINKKVSQEHGSFLDALNAGLIRIPHFATGGVVGGVVQTVSSLFTSNGDMKKEFKKLSKVITKNRPVVNNYADTDWTKFRRGEKKLQRIKASFAL